MSEVGIAPEDQDKLAQLFGGKLGGNVADLFAKGASGMSPNPTPAMPIPGMPQSAGPVAPPPGVSDDPAITGQPATIPMPGAGAAPPMPKVPTFQQPPVATMQDLSQKISQASQPVRRQDYQPHWWEKLLSVPVAGIEGYGNAKMGIDAGRAVLDRRYNRAVENQQKTVTPLQAEFERQSKIEPFQRAANENSQRTFEDTMQNVRETREQSTATSNAQYKSDIADVRQQIADNNLESAKAKLDELSERNRNNMEMQQQLLGIRQQLADARDRQVDKPKGTAPQTQAQKDAVENAKASAIQKAHLAYQKATDGLPTDPKAKWTDAQKSILQDAKDEYTQSMQDAENAYEAKIADAGGSAPHQDVTAGDWAKGKPKTGSSSATPAAGAASSAPKSATKATVQAYADKKKITYDQALKGFKSQGYNVQ